MAGKIIADTIESAGSQISLNVGNVTVLTASSTGLTLIPTTNVNINVTNSNLIVGSGNVSRPSLTFSGNTTTGIFMPAANTIAFGTAGTEDMRIDASGNVGIGTSSPGTQLNVYKSTATAVNIRPQNSLAYADFGPQADGGVYAPYASPAASTYLIAGTTNSNPFVFYTNGSERMRIDSSGNLIVGKTVTDMSSSGFTASATGMSASNSGADCANFNRNTSDGTAVIFRRQSLGVGVISVTTSATSYGTSSDYRLKEDIVPMTGALAKVALLKPVTYKWKVNGTDGQGFIAHELQEVMPDCVIGEKDAVDANAKPVHQSVDTSFLVATLTAAIQELKAIVDAQAVEIAALKAK